MSAIDHIPSYVLKHIIRGCGLKVKRPIENFRFVGKFYINCFIIRFLAQMALQKQQQASETA